MSSGVIASRHPVAAVDATAVRTPTGSPGCVAASSASTPELAAVSPKRASGVCSSAKPTPR